MGRESNHRDPETIVEGNDNLKRCGKCANCLKIKKIKRQIMPSPYSIPPKHATDTDVQLWNKSLEQYPCTGNAKTTEAYTNEAKKWIAGAVEHEGSLRRHLGKKKGEKITSSDIESVLSDPKETLHRKKQAQLAKTLGKLGEAIANHDQKERKIDYDKWFETYKPVKNHINENAPYDGYMFETYGKEARYVENMSGKDRGKIWTLVDTMDGVHIINSLAKVDAIGYFITKKSVNPSWHISVLADVESEEDVKDTNEAKKWIASAVEHEGSLRRYLGKKNGEKITKQELEKIIADPGETTHRKKQAHLAMTLSKFD